MYKRRGLSHIEFVISFLIFIAFIVFAFMFFNPLQSNRTLSSTLDYAWIEIGDATKSNLETYSVVIKVDLVNVAINILEIPIEFKPNVEDINGDLILSYRDDRGYVHFKRPSDNFVRIKYSPIFLNGPQITGNTLGTLDYTISSSGSEKAYFQKLLLDLNESYFSDYSNLKKEFNLPNRIEFGFRVVFNDGSEITALNEIPKEVDVLSKNDRVEIVNSSGTKEYAEMSVIVW